MPAITLGLAEVEERLRALRRRLNAVTVQHGAYVAATAMFIVLTVIVVAGLRASASVFRVTAWVGTASVLIVASVCAVYTRRNWLDIAQTAHLADARGQLTDRLATLIDLRVRPRPSRLAPILVAQTLALSPSWHPARIAPRRIPRSVFAPVTALLMLAGTLFLERHTPPPRPPAPAAPQRSAASIAAPPINRMTTSAGSTEHGGGSEGLSGGENNLLPGANSADGQGDGAEGKQQSSDSGPSAESAQEEQSLTGRLQRTIQHALNPDAAARPEQVAARVGSRSGTEGRDAGGQHEGGPQTTRQREGENAATSGQTNDSNQQRQPFGSKPQNQDPQNQAGTDAPRDFSGSAPAAGSGSNPQGLMDPNAPGGAVTESDAKRFKLTITSFLHPVQSQPNPHASRPDNRAGTLAPGASASGADVELSEHQIADDALRKADIPPEYEELVRRVYSKRGEP